ncbi:MAG: signal peptidase I [Clostridia bacterium]|nr:signal peptidase I [Clostridia bacterium]
MKKALSIIASVLVTVIVIFAVIMTAMVIISTKSESGMPNLFGKSVFFVKTDSMQGPQGFNQGDLIVVDLLTEEEADNLKVGDVITFWRVYEGEKYLETHRIVEDVYTPYKKEVVDGILIHGGHKNYVTRGDNTIDIDYVSDLSGPDYANAKSVVGKWTGVAIPKIGSILDFLQQPTGFLICVVIPMAVFFFYEAYRFIATLNDRKKQSAMAAVSGAEEEIKAKAIAEYIAQQQAQAAASSAPAPAQPEPPKQKTEEEIKAAAVAEFLAQQQAAQAPAEPPKPKTEEEIKQEAIAEFLAKQQTAQAPVEPPQPKTAVEIKQEAIAEFLAKQAADSEK